MLEYECTGCKTVVYRYCEESGVRWNATCGRCGERGHAHAVAKPTGVGHRCPNGTRARLIPPTRLVHA